jgi:UDP-2,4-diacetamido-2,4,6-trideoxy-beta-L-altropyranose hydrolase
MRLLIHADAGTAIGTGHLMRCLALAQACQDDGGSAAFFSHGLTPALAERLQRENFELLTSDDGSHAADWIVVDGYQFDSDYQSRIANSGRRLLWIDDEAHAAPYAATLVLNQNLHAHPDLYRERAASTRLLLGPRYALLRREFQRWRDWQRPHPSRARKVLVTLGGGDPKNMTLEIIRALRSLDDVDAVVVAGATNPHFAALEAAAGDRIRLQRNVTEMSELMAWADVAIAAAGSTSWELAFMGLPSLLLTLAANQRPVAEALYAAGVAIDLARDTAIAEPLTLLLADAALREEMSRRGRALVDGRGASRVIARMHASMLELREAEDSDSRLIWEWANDPGVRDAAFTAHQIPWDEHAAWWRSHFNSGDCRIYIAANGTGPVGQLRYDLADGVATITISVDRAFRDRGYGSAIIELGSEKLFADSTVTRIDAFVKPENAASRHAFQKAGFTVEETTSVRGVPALRLAKRKVR